MVHLSCCPESDLVAVYLQILEDITRVAQELAVMQAKVILGVHLQADLH